MYFAMDEADVKRVLAFPSAMVGSDGLPPTTEGEVRPPSCWNDCHVGTPSPCNLWARLQPRCICHVHEPNV